MYTFIYTKYFYKRIKRFVRMIWKFGSVTLHLFSEIKIILILTISSKATLWFTLSVRPSVRPNWYGGNLIFSAAIENRRWIRGLKLHFWLRGMGDSISFWGAISLRSLVVPSPQKVINLPGPMRSYMVKENPIGYPVVS